jgi:hypothetical protein
MWYKEGPLWFYCLSREGYVCLTLGNWICSVQVHLFDIDIPGKITFKESDTLTPGDSLTIVDTGLDHLT